VAIVYQISLHGDAFDAREKDWAQIIAESGCKPDRAWVDPLLGRGLLKTEFGCSVSHFRVWQKIAASGVAGIVLEEDAVFASFDVAEVEGILKSHDSVWLGHRENSLGYWYNAHAYAITSNTAAMLCEGFAENIIPSDEWLPLKLKNYFNYFYKPELVKQIPRSVRPSEIEGGSMINVITVGTDESKMSILRQSAIRNQIKLVNLGKNVPWRGGDMAAGQGGGQKINLIRQHIGNLPDDAPVLFIDGYDGLFVDNTETIEERFLGFDCDILFAAEKNCWPDPDMWVLFPKSETPYRYLNSGLFMGRAGALKSFFNMGIDDKDDDQLWVQQKFLEPNGLNIKLDYEGYVFQCDDEVKVEGSQISNGMCFPCVYHGNGGDEAKQRYKGLARDLGYTAPQEVLKAPEIASLNYDEVAKDILVVPFLSEEQCKNIISKSEAVGGWGAMDGDKFPAQEIRADKLGMWTDLEKAWKDYLGKVAESKWTPMEHIGLRDAFTMRYAMDTQTSLGFHTDASLVTGSVKLNEDYEGAELVFPHQNFSNINVPLGHCILFPSAVTHGHKVNPLISGVKYSLTMWTSRFVGDQNL
jgi:hypothetical protein